MNLFIRCGENHICFIKGTADKEKQLKFFLKKCDLRNKEECNKFITSLKKLTGNLKLEYNSDENLCLMYRELYANEKDINWGDVKSLIKKGATPEEIDNIYPCLGMHEKLPAVKAFFEVAFESKHGKVNNKKEIELLMQTESMLPFDFYDFSDTFHSDRKDDVSSTEETINLCLKQKETSSIDLRGLKWLFCYQKKNPKNPDYSDYSDETETDSN